MGGFLAELRRRHIFRISGVYIVAAWGVAQVIDLLSQTFALPDWIAQPVLVVLAIGLPFTLLAAWMIVGASNESERSSDGLKATKADWVIGGGLIAVLLAIGYQQFTTPSSRLAPSDQSDSATAGQVPNSVAILPFENVSPDPNDAYFATGIHDETISQLSKISDLRVIARTSVLQYPGSGKTIPEIAAELNVTTVLEGSVRIAGDAVRVIANLIDGATSTPIWTDTYDGDLSDIFAIQADIATQIASALQAELQPNELESIERLPTDSPAAYAEYLRALTLIRRSLIGTGTPIEMRLEIHSHLDEALKLDPQFALAHAWKAHTYGRQRAFDQVAADDWLETKQRLDRLVDLHADMALALDPSIALAHGARAFMHYYSWRAGPAQFEADQALQRNPTEGTVFNIAANVAAFMLNEPERAVQYQQRYVELDPNSSSAFGVLGDWLHLAGRYAEASQALRHCLDLDPPQAICAFWLARSEFAQDNLDAALDALRLTEQLQTAGIEAVRWARICYAYGLLGQFDDAQRAFANVLELAAGGQNMADAAWAWAYMGVGQYDEALRHLSSAAEHLELEQSPYAAHYIRLNVWSDPMLEQPEFVEVRSRLRPTE